MSFSDFSFSSGQVLTSSAMNALQTNFTTLALQNSGTLASSGTPIVRGIPHAWVSYGAAGGVIDGYGASSVTYLGGDTQYQINWTVPLSGDYGLTWGFRAGTGQGSNLSYNIMWYEQNSAYVRVFNRVVQSQGDDDVQFEGCISVWQG